MAIANITWGEERIAHELLVKLGVRVSPRTVRKYIPIRDDGSPDRRNASHRWATFVDVLVVWKLARLGRFLYCFLPNSPDRVVTRRRGSAYNTLSAVRALPAIRRGKSCLGA